MNKTQKSFGDHYLVEFIDCNPETLKHVKPVENILLDAAKASKATILQSYFRQFEPIGVTGIIMIAESHFALHTWPEDNYAAFDILTCGPMDAQKAIDHIAQSFEAKNVKQQVIQRGF